VVCDPRVFQAIARDAPLGTIRARSAGIKATDGRCVDADPREALIGEDGAVETGRGAFSVEPFSI
jgi:hypothetical protein